MNDIIKDKLKAMNTRRAELEKAARFAQGQRNSLLYALGKVQGVATDLERQISAVDAKGKEILAELQGMDGVVKFIKEVTATDRGREDSDVRVVVIEPKAPPDTTTEAPSWEVVDSPDGQMCHVRWSAPYPDDTYLMAAHYPTEARHLAESNADQWNREGKMPSDLDAFKHNCPTYT